MSDRGCSPVRAGNLLLQEITLMPAEDSPFKRREKEQNNPTLPASAGRGRRAGCARRFRGRPPQGGVGRKHQHRARAGLSLPRRVLGLLEVRSTCATSRRSPQVILSASVLFSSFVSFFFFFLLFEDGEGQALLTQLGGPSSAWLERAQRSSGVRVVTLGPRDGSEGALAMLLAGVGGRFVWTPKSWKGDERSYVRFMSVSVRPLLAQAE